MIRPREDCPLPVADAESSVWTVDSLPEELEYFRHSDAYRVETEIFNGPLDLLLHLIQKDRIDIYDIPIARITDQFLEYVELMQLLPLDDAGDFLVMAATLTQIKARLLLPVQLNEDLEEEDPRAELVRRLLEYRRFKEAAADLQRREEERRQLHLRKTTYPFLSEAREEPPLRLELFDLLKALTGIIDRIDSQAGHDVVREPFTVKQKIDLIIARIAERETMRFDELFNEDAIKMEVIVTFIAILELVKIHRLEFTQTHGLGPLWLRRGEQIDAAAPVLLEAEADA